jgi:hypothetical protein
VADAYQEMVSLRVSMECFSHDKLNLKEFELRLQAIYRAVLWNGFAAPPRGEAGLTLTGRA